MTERESRVRWSDRPRFGLGAGALILDPDDRLLLIEQERFGERVWTVPGGGLELGETVEEGARREIYEEVGLRVGLERLIAVEQWVAADGLVGLGLEFLARPDPWPQQVVLGDEEDTATFLDHGWFTRAEALRLENLWVRDLIIDSWPTEIVAPIFRHHPYAEPLARGSHLEHGDGVEGRGRAPLQP